jgi:DNA repair protein RAD50
MRYHAMKMEEINKIIKELWQATYKGNDIDTIEMKSDVDTSSTNKRTYPCAVINRLFSFT